MLLVDTNVYCGVGTFQQSDAVGTTAHDLTGYARVDGQRGVHKALDAEALRVSGSHLDLLLGHDAARAVHRPVTDWLDARRHAAWTEQRAAS